MDGRIRKTCHVCGKQNLLQLNNHLTQMHGWNSEQKKQFKLNQMGMGKKDDISEDGEDVEITDEDDESSISDDVKDDVFGNSVSDDDDDESDYCSEDEETDRIWRGFRNEVAAPYSELFHERLEKLKQENPNMSERELKGELYQEFKRVWIDDAAEYLKCIITYYEHFQTDDYVGKILDMRDELCEKGEPEQEALEMAINLYKSKLGKLFTCNFDIPK